MKNYLKRFLAFVLATIILGNHCIEANASTLESSKALSSSGEIVLAETLSECKLRTGPGKKVFWKNSCS